MDRLAEALGIDPIELRLLNALEPGDTLPTGQVLTGSLPVAEVIRAAAAIPVPEPEPLPRDPIRLPGGAGNTTRGEGVRRGVGFAVGLQEHLLLGGLRRLLLGARAAPCRRERGRALRRGRGRAGRRRRDPAGGAGRARDGRRRARAHDDGDRRLGRIDVRLADDVDGCGRRAGRVPRRARGARGAGRGRGRRRARLPARPDDAARSRDRAGHWASGRTSRSRPARCGSSSRSTSSSG